MWLGHAADGHDGARRSSTSGEPNEAIETCVTTCDRETRQVLHDRDLDARSHRRSCQSHAVSSSTRTRRNSHIWSYDNQLPEPERCIRSTARARTRGAIPRRRIRTSRRNRVPATARRRRSSSPRATAQQVQQPAAMSATPRRTRTTRRLSIRPTTREARRRGPRTTEDDEGEGSSGRSVALRTHTPAPRAINPASQPRNGCTPPLRAVSTDRHVRDGDHAHRSRRGLLIKDAKGNRMGRRRQAGQEIPGAGSSGDGAIKLMSMEVWRQPRYRVTGGVDYSVSVSEPPRRPSGARVVPQPRLRALIEESR